MVYNDRKDGDERQDKLTVCFMKYRFTAEPGKHLFASFISVLICKKYPNRHAC